MERVDPQSLIFGINANSLRPLLGAAINNTTGSCIACAPCLDVMLGILYIIAIVVNSMMKSSIEVKSLDNHLTPHLTLFAI